MVTAIYPGSFDPITYGHIDIIRRAAKTVDKLVIGVLNNTSKTPLFTSEERVEMICEAVRDIPNVTVEAFSGLSVDFAKAQGAGIIVRGLRAVTDFEYELQIAHANRTISGGWLDTIFITSSMEYAYLSSSAVKEIASFGGDIKLCVPPIVEEEVIKKMKIRHPEFYKE